MDFAKTLAHHGLRLRPVSIDTLQINMGKLCNQACKHCHVDAGPLRTEMMSGGTVDRCLAILAGHPQIRNLDITGGAPELNEHFERLVIKATLLGKRVMIRHNLTVSSDPHPVTGKSMAHLPEFFKVQRVELVCSLPYFQEQETDAQRGKGVFRKSIDALRLLNDLGFGKPETGLVLNLVHNPAGAFLPPSQPAVESQFRQELLRRHGLVFNSLFVITNMPINRFRHFLEKADLYEAYMTRLMNAFNPAAAEGVMCRAMLSVGCDGTLYDCDFNQMLEWPVDHGAPGSVEDFDYDRLLNREIEFGSHCFGCTAGAGSSCGGAVVR